MSGTTSASFDRLDQRVQRWVWMQRWTELRDIQEQAIGPVLEERDLLLASATASGKTEAAFLPIASAVAEIAHDQLAVLYVAPLKALINDQHRRLESLFASIDAAVTPWHGDVAGSQKRRLLERPAGVLLITPESLEALFVTRGTQTRRIFSSLRYIVVDELHAFIGTERGRQLQSLLHRVELAAARPIPRIALSATMGDLDVAAEFLRPRHGGAVLRIESTTFRHDLQLQVRGSRTPAPGAGDTQTPADAEEVAAADEMQIAAHLYRVLRGGTHLVFANRRVDVERYADLLRRRCEQDRVPNEFWPHHGSLSRQLREDAEEILRSGRPATVLATTTLELGIDVGSVDSVAQLGPPPSVAAMRQRLGRSGRRADQASRFRIYGYKYEIESGTRTINEAQAHAVRRIFEDFIGLRSCNRIANDLNEDGVPAFNGGYWYPLTVRRIVMNETYTGRTIYRRTQVQKVRNVARGKWTRRIVERDPEEWIEIEGATPPIISRETFERARARMADPVRFQSRPNRVYALAGRIRCIVCNASMTGQALMQGRYEYYRCRRSYGGPKHDRCESRYVPRPLLESAVKGTLTDVLSDPQRVMEELRGAMERPVVVDRRDAIEAELADIEARQRRLLKLILGSDRPDHTLEEERQRLAEQERQLKADRAAIAVPVGPQWDFDAIARHLPATLDEIRTQLGSDGENFDLLLRAVDARGSRVTRAGRGPRDDSGEIW